MPVEVDSKLRKFGVYPEDAKRGYKGRRIDFLRRAIDTDLVQAVSQNPGKAIIEYLKEGRTRTARELASKAVIALWPDHLLGKVLWSSH